MSDDLQSPLPAPASVEPQPAGPGGMAVLIGMFFQPGASFKALADKPRFLWPLIGIVVVTLLSQAMLLPRIDMVGSAREVLERFGQGDKVTDEKLQEEIANQGPVQKVAQVVGPLFTVPTILLVLSVVYMLGLKVAGSTASYDRVLAVVTHASAPPWVVKTLLTVVVGLQRTSFTAMEMENLLKSNLGAWLGSEAPKALVALGSVLDIFNVWLWVLLVLGFEVVGRVRRGAAVAVVAGLWALYAVGRVGFALLF
jgi:hypothetical protein